MTTDPATTLPLGESEALEDRETRGRMLGRYVLLDQLGVGGTGEVFVAYDPELDRRVAVKRLHAGTEVALVREARLLATLNHPNVVTVHDVGVDDGRAYLAMELVEGEDLARWLAHEHAHSWVELVAIVVAAAAGLTAAHGAGIVHGDVKPANILVGKDGRVLVSDFGVARRGTRPDGDGQEGGTAGTPRYMAPEQHRGDAPDARSDVYSLGVTAWEALFSDLPFRVVAPLPSPAAGTTAGASFHSPTGRGTGPAALLDLLEAKEQGPPDAPNDRRGVPAKTVDALRRALAPEPGDRFESVAAFAQALAADDTGGRGPQMLVGAAVVAVAAVAGWAVLTEREDARCTGANDEVAVAWGASQRQAVLAAADTLGPRWPAATATLVVDGLDRYADEWAEMHRANCVATTIRGEQAAEDMKVRARCLARARTELAATADLLADADPEIARRAPDMVAALPGVAQCRDVVSIEASVGHPTDPELAAAVEEIREAFGRGTTVSRAGRHQEARRLLEPLAERAEGLAYGPLLVEMAPGYGFAVERGGDHERAEEIWKRAVALGVEAGPPLPAAQAAARLVHHYTKQDARYDEAKVYAAIAVSLARRGGNGTAVEAFALNRRGSLRLDQSEFEAAEADLMEALALWKRVRPPDHPDIAMGLTSLGNLHYDRGDLEAAETFHQQSLEVMSSAFGPKHPQLAVALDNLGRIDERRGNYAAALEKSERALALMEPALGPDHIGVAGVLTNMAETLGRLGRAEEAEATHRRALSIVEAVRGPEHVQVGRLLNNIGVVELRKQDFAAAEATFVRGLKIVEASLGEAHPDVTRTLMNLAITVASQGRLSEAAETLRRALALREAHLPAGHRDIASTLGNLGLVELMLEEYVAATEHFERALAIRDAGGAEPKDRAFETFGLARALWAGGDEARGIALAEEARQIYVGAGPGFRAQLAEVEAWLAAPTAKVTP
ncbi:MAG: serine/threonine-protein kinase [Myxococcota bacterium]